MLITISPSKTLDLDPQNQADIHTTPDQLAESQRLVKRLRELSAKDLRALMSISDRLAELNHQRFKEWKKPFTPGKAKQAVLAFQGDVYQGLDAATLSAEDLEYAQDHLRILSGLYGALRPLDLILPYRLEMGTRLSNARGKNLYEFWGDRITDKLSEALAAQGDDLLVNLASNEYFKAVRPKRLRGRILTPVFKEAKGGGYRVIGVFAKKARGLMSRYIIQNRIGDPEALKEFTAEGYRFNPDVSTETVWAFTRG